MWWVLLLTVCGLFTAFMIIAYFQTKGDRENREGYEQYRAASAALHKVYQKLMMSKTNTVADTGTVIIQPGDVRRALARGTNDLGELLASLADHEVYVAKEGVPSSSGKFICFVLLGKRRFPYGLTSNGECRYTKAGEVMKKDISRRTLSQCQAEDNHAREGGIVGKLPTGARGPWTLPGSLHWQFQIDSLAAAQHGH